MNEELKQLESIFQAHDKITRGMVSKKEFETYVESVISSIKVIKDYCDEQIRQHKSDILSEVDSPIKELSYSLNELELGVKDLINNSERTSLVKIKELSQRISSEINRVESSIPEIKDFTAEISYLDDRIKTVDTKIEKENGESIVSKINSLDDDDLKIEAKHISGLPESSKDVSAEIATLQNRTQLLNQISGGLDRRIALIESGSTVSGVSSIIAGTNITIDQSTGDVTISSTGGSGSGYQAPTSGTVDGLNQTFTFSTAPNVIVSDGVIMRKTQSDGTVHWSGTTTITLVFETPSYDLYAIA